MKNQDHYRIGSLEINITMLAFIIAIGVLTIPRSLAQELETTDGWISITISGVIVMGIVTLYVRLQRFYPGQNILQYLGNGPIGKWVAKCLAFLFFIYFIILSAHLVRMLSVVVKMYLLDQTPSEVIVASMLLLTTYAVYTGVQGAVHLNLMFMPIIFIVVFGILTFNLPKFSVENLRPVLAEGVSPVLIAVKETIFAFAGVEILFFFMAYMKKSDLRTLPLNISIGILTLLYILVTVFSYSVFSLDATKFITFPTIELAKEIEIPGAFFERLESLMMSVWLMTLFNSLSMNQFLAYFVLKSEVLSSKKESSRKIGPFLPFIVQFIIFIIAFIPNSLTETFTFSDWIGWLDGFLILAVLSFGYLTVWFRNHQQFL